MFKIKLGSKVKDKVSGLTGIVTAQLRYISGCIQYGVVGKASKDDKIPDTHYLDENRLTVLSGGVELAQRPAGGEHTPPKFQGAPTR